MAEIGLIASGMGIASLGIQIGSGIIKLKQLWDDVKDAPEEIQYLLDEIETLSQVLSAVDDNEGLPQSAAKSLELCSKGATLLKSILDDLQASVGKRKRLGGLKSVLKKGTVDRLRERLKALNNQHHASQKELAIAHQRELQELKLTFSQSITTASFASQQHITSVTNSRITEVTEVTEEAEDVVQSQSTVQFESKDGERNCRKLPRRYASQRRFMARFQTPRWFSTHVRALEICCAKAPFGWDFSIRPYQIVPRDSEIFEYAADGNIKDGWTVLDRAAFWEQVEVCRFLMTQGADPNVSYESSSLVVACKFSQRLDITEIFDLFSKDVEIVDPFDGAYAIACLNTLLWFLNTSQSSYRSRNIEERVQFAMEILSRHDEKEQGAVVDFLLDGRKIDDTICNISDEHGNTLLSKLAYKVGYCYRDLNKEESKPVQLLSLLSDLVIGGSNLTSVSKDGRLCHTPLLNLISGLNNYRDNPDYNHIESVLMTWIKALKESGVDLEEYGREEQHIHLTCNVVKNWCIHELSSRNGKNYIVEIRLVRFKYGPEPEDWKFWFIQELEPWFFEFWDMVDHPERAMPGTWNDHNYHNYYDGYWSYDV
ncbi:hypothetical protein EG329_013892 [Mollisiaceae sp. DMI_Dod_QoI]|nr:hypothetical protein EG329_013892 [Helotiales sp. DMI_Dod_QoI]